MSHFTNRWILPNEYAEPTSHIIYFRRSASITTQCSENMFSKVITFLFFSSPLCSSAMHVAISSKNKTQIGCSVISCLSVQLNNLLCNTLCTLCSTSMNVLDPFLCWCRSMTATGFADELLTSKSTLCMPSTLEREIVCERMYTKLIHPQTSWSPLPNILVSKTSFYILLVCTKTLNASLLRYNHSELRFFNCLPVNLHL